MSGHRSYQELREERRAKMSPEKRAYSDGYTDGFADAANAWDNEIMGCSVRSFLKWRKSLRRERKVNK